MVNEKPFADFVSEFSVINIVYGLPGRFRASNVFYFLSVKNNKLPKLPDSIAQLESLTVLDVRGNSFSKNYIEELKALLSGCEIRC